jgi:hypothetical protein
MSRTLESGRKLPVGIWHLHNAQAFHRAMNA